MTIKQIIGYVLVALPFIGVAVVGALIIGVWETIGTFALTAIIGGMITAGVFLIMKGD